jgi:hypothetical protein
MNTEAAVRFETVRELALALPEVTEDTSYNAPAFRLRNKLLAHLREDGETLVITIDQAEREFWLLTNPDTYFITDHYTGYRKMLVRLANVQREELELLLKQAWRTLAPKRLRERVSL